MHSPSDHSALASVVDATEAVVVLDTRVLGCLGGGGDHVRVGWCPTRAFVASSRLGQEIPVPPVKARALARRVIRAAERVAVPSDRMTTTKLHATLRWRVRRGSGPWHLGKLEFISIDGWDDDAPEFYDPTRALVNLAERIAAQYPLDPARRAAIERLERTSWHITGMNARSFRGAMRWLRERGEDGAAES